MEPVLGFAVRDGVAEGEAVDAFQDECQKICSYRLGSPHMRGLLRSSQKDPFAIRAPSLHLTLLP